MEIKKETHPNKNCSYSADDYIARLRSSAKNAPEIDSSYFDKLLGLPSPLKEQAVVAYLLDLGKCAELNGAQNASKNPSENNSLSFPT